MAARGWYPDPSGQPGRYRYWDGTRWSAETTTDPTRPYSGPAGGSDGRGRPRLILLALVAVLAIAAVITTIAVLVGRDTIRADDNPPVSTVSGWNDSSPTADRSTHRSSSPGGHGSPATGTANSTTTGPVPSPTGAVRPDGTGLPPPTVRPKPAADGACPQYRPDTWSEQPDPTRIRGGDLSIPRLGPPWDAVTGDPYTVGWGWARDIGGMQDVIDYGDNATLFVGAVRPMAKHPDESVKRSALRLSRCVVQDYVDQHLVVTGVRRLQSRTITVDGHHGWLVRTQSAIDDLQHGADGLLADIVVVDTGNRLSFFYGEVPYPDRGRIQVMDAMTEALQVD